MLCRRRRKSCDRWLKVRANQEALWDSTYQLRAIGRNLNQIAKRLNEGEPASVKSEQLEKLASFIYKHTAKVAAVQDASLSRWKLLTSRN